METVFIPNRLANPAGLTSIASLASSFVATCLLTQLAVLTASASLISNGSFESPMGTPGLNSGRPDGWSGYASFVNGVINGTLPDFPAPQDGNQFVNIAAGELSSSFTIFTPGDYLLTWYDNSLTTGWNGSYGLLVKDSSLVTVSSTAYSYSYLGPAAWKKRSLELPDLVAGTYAVSYSPGTSYTFLDNVSLDATPVPEPPTVIAGALLLLPIGITIFGALRKTRTA